MNGPQPTSYTVWERLEPVARDYELDETLRAEVHDPLWALTRQWQLGEFEGHDGGSPVGADVTYYQDDVTSVEIAGTTHSYDPETDGPLEAMVEREQVATDGPNHRLRLEAGMNFLDRLRREAGSNRPSPRPDSFDATYRLDLSDEHRDAGARRFEHVVATDHGGDGTDTRALDGYLVYDALDRHARDPSADSFDWANADPGDLPVPDGWSGLPTPFQTAAEGFYGWYEDLYDEPESATADAWNEDRLEYEFAVETSGNGVTTRFEADEYTGGRLDWDDLSVTGGTDSGSSGSPQTLSRQPTRLGFRGMPKPRYWELEDAAVNFDDISAATEDVGWLTMVEIGLLAGTDWYTLPIEADYGTLTRVTDLTVTDTFGDKTTVPAKTPVETTERQGLDDKGWNAFLFDLPHRSEPGLLVPPVLGPAAESDPVERVRFTRDESANLVFAIENLVEGPLGDPLDRGEFDRPEVVVSDVVPASDPDQEYIEFENRGDDAVDLAGWKLRVSVASGASGSFSFDGDSAAPGGKLLVHTFGSVEVEPRGRIRLYTGGFRNQNTDEDRYHGASQSLWARGGDLASYELHRAGSGTTLVLEEPVGTVSASSNPRYRLATDVPDHWFPLKADPSAPDDYLLEVALLFDADTLANTADKVPTPLGEILTKEAEIYEEEVSRRGKTVTRRYQLAADSKGHMHLWSGRNVSVGGGEESSGLRFDFLEEPES